MRIVSLLASGTEVVCALGAGDALVGRSHECDHPVWVSRLPQLSRPTFDVGGTSGQIDRLVRERLRAGAPLYEVDHAALAALAPDVVITQVHCDVCAVGPDDVTGPACPRPPAGARTVAMRAGSLDGILEDFAAVAQAIERTEAGAELVAALRAGCTAWGEATRALPRRRVVCLEWIDPVFAMSNWGPELVALAGGEDLLGTPGVHSRASPWEAVRAADPEVLVVAPCGFSLARALGEMPTLEAQPGWRDLRAVRSGEVFVADGNRYFNRSGPGAFETIGLLAEMFHPARFPPEHEGSAWRRWAGG